MSPEQMASKIGEVGDEIECLIRLFDVGWMAAHKLEETEREALSELLAMVVSRLSNVCLDLTQMQEKQAA